MHTYIHAYMHTCMHACMQACIICAYFKGVWQGYKCFSNSNDAMNIVFNYRNSNELCIYLILINATKQGLLKSYLCVVTTALFCHDNH